jgi:antitoxin component YwqK of YwqJK toxin-antitoxin module
MKTIFISIFSLLLCSNFFKNEKNIIVHNTLGKIVISFDVEKSQIIKNVFSPEGTLSRKVVYNSNTRKPLISLVYSNPEILSEKIEYFSDEIHSTHFYQNGNIHQVFYYDANFVPLKHSLHYENGNIRETGPLTSQWQRTGVWEFYDSNGNLVNKKEVGVQ